MLDKQERRAARVEVLLNVYKRWISPALQSLPGALAPFRSECRYLPTCSEYAAIAIVRHGWIGGMGRAGWRLLRCHPWSRGGFDPVR